MNIVGQFVDSHAPWFSF